MLLAALHGGAFAGPEVNRQALRALRDQARRIQEEVRQTPAPAWLYGGANRLQGEVAANALTDRILGREAATAPAGEAAQAGQGRAGTLDILVTRALGEAALREIFATASRTPEARVVFRGVNAGESLMDFLRSIAPLIKDMDRPPGIEIDPRPFREIGAQTAPVMIMRAPDGTPTQVAGLSNPQWLLSAVEEGQRGDLGTRGPVVAISESDMIAEMQRRAAALDLDALREQAIQRYWAHATFEPLPVATQRRERRIDPTVTAPQDLALPDGKVLVRAGERINPLDKLAFTQRLVVFDATAPEQVRTARALGEAPGVTRVVYMTTALDRAQGWDALKAIEAQLEEPVYLLSAQVRERFSLEHVPASVDARDRAFIVTEVPPEGQGGAPTNAKGGMP